MSGELELFVDQLRSEDQAAFHALFREAFSADISSALREWKYGGGRGRQDGVFLDHQRRILLAHCGAMFRRSLVLGQARVLPQYGDLMVGRDKPGGLARASSVYHLIVRHICEHAASPDNPDALTFGFPSRRASKLSEQLGLSLTLNEMHELAWEPAAPQASRWLRLLPIRPLQAGWSAALAREADRLWARMAASLGVQGVLGVRDAAYLRYRYLERPGSDYLFYRAVGWFGRALGWAICRRQGDELEVLDLLAGRQDMPRVLALLREHLPSLGVGVMKLWLTDHHAARMSAELPARVTPLEFRLAVNLNSSGGDVYRFRDRWWLTSGDTDYR